MVICVFIHVAGNGVISSFIMDEQRSIVYVYCIFIHAPVAVYLGCFRVLAVRNSAAVNAGVHVIFSNQRFLQIQAQE